MTEPDGYIAPFPERSMIGRRSAETIRVDRDRIDDCRRPECWRTKETLAEAGSSIDVSGLFVELLVLRATMGIRFLVSMTTWFGQVGLFPNSVFTVGGSLQRHP
jgi:hypothetical protein